MPFLSYGWIIEIMDCVKKGDMPEYALKVQGVSAKRN